MMTTNPSLSATVTVCIPTFNQAPFLMQAVQSALDQTYPNVQVLISDDASTDETPEVVKAFENNPRVTYYRQVKNLGISANNNWLLSQPETEFIIRLDSDDLLLPDYTSTLISLFLTYPEAGYAHAAVNEIDSFNHHRRVRRLFGRPEYQHAEDALKAGLSGYRVAANICMFRRSVLHEMNFYKPEMNFCEDWELSVRIADAGYGNIYYPEPLACYRVWTDQGNVRASRKLTEINGAYELYQYTYLPIFKKRQWDTGIVEQQKKTYALHHSICLAQKNFTGNDKEQIKALLRTISPGDALEKKMRMVESSWFMFIQFSLSAEKYGKDLIKWMYQSIKR